MSISWKDLDRLLAEFPDVKERVYKFGEGKGDNDLYYFYCNKDAAIWLLDNADLILQALSIYCEDENIVNGLLKLLEKRSEIKLSHYQDAFYVEFPINSETPEDIDYLESLGWKEVEYQWIYRKS